MTVKKLIEKTLDGIWFVATALILPIDIKFKKKKWLPRIVGNMKKTFIFLGTYFLLQPASTFLFPRAQDVFRKDGLNPALVEKIAPGKDVRIMPDNFWSKLHLVFSQNIAFFPFTYKRSWGREGVASFTIPSSRFPFNNVGCVYLTNPEGEARILANVKKNVEKTSHGVNTVDYPLTDAQCRNFVLVHEVRHCADANQNQPSDLFKECDADYTALQVLSAGDPILREKFMRVSCAFMGGDQVHETILYMDAKVRGVPVPSTAEIMAAGREAAPFVLALDEVYQTYAGSVEPIGNFSYDPETTDTLSPLAKRRVQLAEESLPRLFVRAQKKDTMLPHDKGIKPSPSHP